MRPTLPDKGINQQKQSSLDQELKAARAKWATYLR